MAGCRKGRRVGDQGRQGRQRRQQRPAAAAETCPRGSCRLPPRPPLLPPPLPQQPQQHLSRTPVQQLNEVAVQLPHHQSTRKCPQQVGLEKSITNYDADMCEVDLCLNSPP